MKTFTLPSAEDTILNLTVGDKTVQFDILDYEIICTECAKELQNLGVPAENDRLSYLDLFIQKMESKFQVKLSRTTASELMFVASDMHEEIKKKFFDRLKSYGFMESPLSNSSFPGTEEGEEPMLSPPITETT